MYVQQLYTNCLAEAAYYIESEGEAAIVDPLRETEPYLEMALSRGAVVKYIFETHFHADFVSGHVDLAKKTGAEIVFGPMAKTNYPIRNAKDGEKFQLGKITIQALHTPGHTLESTCYLLINEKGNSYCVFTGDTLFVGDVGRPDLAIGNGLTDKDLAGMLYDSIQKKIMQLPGNVIVYPAHGPGSSCGKNIGSSTFSTIGEEKKSNYALSPISREEFVKELTTGILPPPQYFAKNAQINQQGYEALEIVMRKGHHALSPGELEKHIRDGALLLDTRHQKEFVKGHIPGSLFIGLDGMFAVWVGTLVKDIRRPIVIIAPEGRENEAVMRLARVGYDTVSGYLSGGIEAWKMAGKPLNSLESVTAVEFKDRIKKHNLTVLDVRKPSEYEAGHLENAISFPLDFINEHVNELDKTSAYHVHCRSGYRSVIACSILRMSGYNKVTNVAGGYNAITQPETSTCST